MYKNPCVDCVDWLDQNGRAPSHVKTLRPYQLEQASDIIADLLTRGEAALNSPTGGGKSLISRYSAVSLMRRVVQAATKGALVAAPLRHIRSSWCGALDIYLPSESDPDFFRAPPKLEIFPGAWHKARTPVKTLAKWLTQLYVSRPGYVTTHAGLLMAVVEGALKGLDLTGFLLIIDECQLVEEMNGLGRVIRQWKKQGGMVLWVSATLFRHQGTLPIPKDLIPSFRSVAEHIADGFAPVPEYVFKGFSFEASGKSLAGDILPEGDLSKLAEEIVGYWDSVGRPHYVQNVPDSVKLPQDETALSGSMRWAEQLVEAFHKLDPSIKVFNAVGPDSKVQRGLENVLDSERQRAETGLPSEYHVFIASKRFDMGADWPYCSAVGNVGLTHSQVRSLQRLGRAMRCKKGLAGIPDAYKKKALMVFFLPKHISADAWDEFHLMFHDRVMLLTGSMHDQKTAVAYMAEVRRGVTECYRKRAGSKPENRLVWSKISSLVGVTLAETEEVYQHLKEAVLLLDTPSPSWDDIEGFLRTRLGYDDAKVATARTALRVRADIGNPKVLQRLDAAVTRALKGPQTSDRIIREGLQEIFDEQTNDFTGLIREAKATFELAMEVTGQTAKQVARSLRAGLETPDYSLGEVQDIIRWYYDQTGRLPQPSTKDLDLSPFTGEPFVTFLHLNRLVKAKFQTSISRIAKGMGLGQASGGPKSGLQIRFEKSVLCRPGILEALTEDCIQQMKDNPGVTFSIRAIDEARRLRGEKLTADAGAGSNFYSTVLLALVPALSKGLKCQPIQWTIDWVAIDIDPAHKKWDDYHELAGGTAPRPAQQGRVPYQDDFEAHHRAHPEVLDMILEVLITQPVDSVRQAVNSLRGLGTPINNHFPVFYTRVISALVPAFQGRLKTRAPKSGGIFRGVYVPDWAVLDIDPAEERWGKYHERTLCALPKTPLSPAAPQDDTPDFMEWLDAQA